jgi:biofilm PGA synthesis lipoprotein PgaB
VKPLLPCLLLALVGATAAADQHAVVLLYHHVSEETPASTSISPGQFAKHLDYLQQEGFVVMPLPALLDALYAGESVPANAVAITFDDAYESVLTEAAPLLTARGMPFTVFVATESVDRGYSGYMSWQQMRGLDPQLVNFGGHSVSHAHLLEHKAGESEEQWRLRIEGEIQGSADRIKAELGREVRSFAYPYGEFDGALAELVQSANLYGLAQQSGAVGPGVDARQIPRFPFGGPYAALQRLALAVNARPLPVVASEASAVFVSASEVPDSAKLLLEDGPYRRSTLACYGSSGSSLTLTPLDQGYQIALVPMRPGRNKINCTAASTEQAQEYFWYSRLWIVADEEGAWLHK